MHEKAPILKAELRQRLGTRYARRDREQGRLPGVVYGHGERPVALSLDAKEAVTLIQKGEKVFRLDLKGAGGDQMLLLKDVQFDYLGDTIVHADFARVDLNERVRTRVHVVLKGEAKGLKSAGAIMMHPTNELEIECRVVDLPDFIEVDVSDLDINQAITADKVALPTADMRLLTDPHAIVAQIVEQKEQVVAEAAVVGAEPVAPEVIGEKERAEKAAAAAAAAPAGKGGAPAAKGGAPAAKK